MRYRKLRIAWLVVWGVAAVLLILLWVRSYWRGDSITYRKGNIPAGNAEVGVQSCRGRLALYRAADPYLPFGIGWFLESWGPEMFAATPGPLFVWDNSPNNKCIGVPHWFAVAILAVIAALPLSNRFSFGFGLRTMLIATTLVAVVLGLITWSIR